MASFLTYFKLSTIIVTVASELQKITPIDNVADHDNFGWSVAIHDQHFAVGAHASQNAASYGTVRIFTTDSETNWVENTTLLANDGTIGDLFGYSVSLYDPYIIIGAHKDDDNGAENSGSAYIFARASGTWTFIQKLTASDGAPTDFFGRAVSIYDTYAVIGAAEHDANGANSGAAYIFQGVSNIWTESVKLLPNNGTAGDNFGSSVDIYDTFVVVGAYSHDTAATDAGGAYVFERTNNNWAQHTKLLANDSEASAWFGISVSIYSHFIIVGACYSGNNAGSAYIFAFDEALDTWTQSVKLVPSDAMDNQQFGRAVSIHDKYAVVGTYENPVGSAYVFELDEINNVWTEKVKLVPSDGVDYDKFGHAVANYYGNVVIGAPYVDDNGPNSGSVYVTTMIEASTASPSDNPSVAPSNDPSAAPSDVPSDTPSVTPSNTPSDVPSNTPSVTPSNNPSDVPSDNPSDTPSVVPSTSPSDVSTTVVMDENTDIPVDKSDAITPAMVCSVVVGAIMLYSQVRNA
eukprot:52237_1